MISSATITKMIRIKSSTINPSVEIHFPVWAKMADLNDFPVIPDYMICPECELPSMSIHTDQWGEARCQRCADVIEESEELRREYEGTFRAANIAIWH